MDIKLVTPAYLVFGFALLQLIAMESIYGENLVISDQQRGLRCFQVLYRTQIPIFQLRVIDPVYV